MNKVLIGSQGGADYYDAEDLLRINTYAARKEITRRAVEYQILAGNITPVILDGVSYISWNIYQNYNFRLPNKPKKKHAKTIKKPR